MSKKRTTTTNIFTIECVLVFCEICSANNKEFAKCNAIYFTIQFVCECVYLLLFLNDFFINIYFYFHNINIFIENILFI